MVQLFNTQAPPKRASIIVNGDLLVKARELNINLSAALEEALKAQLKKKQRQLWRKRNSKAIHAYNHFVEEQGVFSDGLRSF